MKAATPAMTNTDSLLHPLAGLGKSPADGEKYDGDPNIERVEHHHPSLAQGVSVAITCYPEPFACHSERSEESNPLLRVNSAEDLLALDGLEKQILRVAQDDIFWKSH